MTQHVSHRRSDEVHMMRNKLSAIRSLLRWWPDISDETREYLEQEGVRLQQILEPQ